MECQKIKYNSKELADGFLGILNGELKSHGRGKLTVSYYCEHCNSWHLTSQRQPKTLEERFIERGHIIQRLQNKIIELKKQINGEQIPCDTV